MLAWLEDGTGVKADDVLALVVRTDPPVGKESARILLTVWIDSVPGAVVLRSCPDPVRAIAAETSAREALEKADRKLIPVAPGISIHPDKLRLIQIRPDPANRLPWAVYLEFDGGPGNFVVLRCLDAPSATEMGRRIAEAINEEDKTFYPLGEWIYFKRDEFEYLTCRSAPDGRCSLQVKLSHKDGLTPVAEFPDNAAMRAWLDAARDPVNEDKDGEDRIAIFDVGWGILPNHLRLLQLRLGARRAPGQPGEQPAWSLVMLHEKFEQPVTLTVLDDAASAEALLRRYGEELRALVGGGDEEEEEDEDEGEEDEEDEPSDDEDA